MATTTKSKAKTKTTKKPAAKSASAKTTKATKTTKVTSRAKTSAAKTTAKAKVAKKSVATKAKKPAVQAPAAVTASVTTVANSSRPALLIAAVFAALAGFAGFFMKHDTVQVFLSHLTKNDLASSAGTVLVSAAHPLYELELRWLLVVLLGVSAVFAVVRGTRLLARETAGIRAGVNSVRWIDYAVTGALVYEIVALLNGLQDLVALKFGMLSIVLVAYFGWMYERENAATGKPARASLIGAQLAALVSVVVLGLTMYGTYIYGLVRSPWYAYAAFAVFVIWTASVVVKLKQTPLLGKHDYVSVDRSHNTWSIVAKVALAAIVIYGLNNR